MRRLACAWGLFVAVGLAGCNAFDRTLEPPAPMDHEGPDSDGGLGDGGDSGGSGGSAGNHSGGSGGTGSGGVGGIVAGEGGGLEPGANCEPPPADAPASCVMVCPEACNGEDDDCDDQIDEDPASSACALDHALAACIAGECLIAECASGYRNCDNETDTGCETASDDLDHCGTCNTKCSIPGAIEACIDHECVATGCDALRGDCEAESDDCETVLTSLENCGDCGRGCEDLPNATGLSCANGECRPTECALGYDDCNEMGGDGCEQILSDVNNCNGCEQSCDLVGSSGDDCDDFVCRAGPCDDGYGDCDGDRLDGCEPLNTTANCQGCNQICGGDELVNTDSESCATGECVLDCTDGFASCDNDPFNGCEASIWQADRCGACTDSVCVLDHATAKCPAGSCEIDTCASGWDDCNDSPIDGCETSLNDDTTCGDCDNDCTVTTDPVCSGGVCGDVTCPTDTADCAQNGLPCEIDLANDVTNCGACGNACAFNTATPHATALSCVSRSCVAQCDPGYDDCNHDYRDGCEAALNTMSNCGACNTACAIANASESCSTGECLVTTCAADFRDCDMDGKSCERSINTVSDCGACNNACNFQNAASSCGGTAGARACVISSCAQFFDDCDDIVSNGCEVNLQTDTDDCGTCNYDCEAEENVNTATCGGGSCTFNCDAGFRDCNNTDADGCEIPINTNANCGGCGVLCSRANASSSCATGSCQLTSCNPGFDQCDGNVGNGCESLSTVTSCGACNVPCLPTNATGTCSTGTCAVSMCNSGWADCDLDPANGCERNTAAPPAGQGPCLPESTCTKQTFMGADYYVCPTAHSWTASRNLCRLQSGGDLVRIDSSGEDAFVRSVIATNSWIGATDEMTFSVEGQWRWSNDTALIWTGTAGGTLAPGMYAQWQSGEPNDSGGNEDCAELYQASGNWNDQNCNVGGGRAFVCEIAGDLCPSDAAKTSPGQCGCGVADTDTDGDHTADCLDGCPTDASKVAGGICGCGVADTNTDGDSAPDCMDTCPTNAPKTAPGMCGCAVADTNSDGDSAADCVDACPNDSARTTLPCAFPYTPSNFDPGPINFSTTPTSTLGCDTTVTIDTGALDSLASTVAIDGWCGASPAVSVQEPAGGTEVVVLALRGLTVPDGTSIRITGQRPVIFAVNGDVSISGELNARGLGATPGAGGNAFCSAGAIGDNGAHDSDGDEGSGGGAGGAFATTGGAGGNGYRLGGNAGLGGAASTAETTTTGNITPLRGGCQGGNGGGTGGGREGGGGGGAIQITATGTITLTSTARISASGGGGRHGNNDEDGGGGGGSGGAVFFEANVVSINGAIVTANGGGGASGNASDDNSGNNGTDGINNGTGTTGGGGSSAASGAGGVGAGQNSGAGAGGNGGLWLFYKSGAGGGGGGGGRGYIRYRGISSCSLGGTSSPNPQANCP